MPLPVARTDSRGQKRNLRAHQDARSLCERPKYSDKDPRGGTDQSANKQHGEQLSRFEWPVPTPVPSEEAPGVRERTHRARSWKSATGSTPPLD